MIDNFNKCCQCGIQRKEEDILTYYSDKTKLFQCKNCLQKNLSKEPQISPDFLSNDKTKFDKINIILKDDKKLDLKEPIITINETNFLKKKKRRISKNIIFKRAKKNKIIDEFTSIIYKIIEQSNKELLINYKDKDRILGGLNTICNICKKRQLNKIIKLSSLSEFKEFFDTIYKNLEQEENSKKLIQIFQNKYEQIIQNKKNINQIKINDINKELLSLRMPQNYCFECIYNYLLKNNGINILWDNLPKEDGQSISNVNIKKNLEIIPGLKDIQTNSVKNNINFNENSTFEEKKDKNNNNENNDILDNDINKMFNGKKLNIFDLILGDEDNDNDNEINDFENNSDENKSIKNKNNDNKLLNDKKLKKNKKVKIKEKKITFKKIIMPNNIQFNKNNINNNLNINIKDENDKNLSNINNINNMAQFSDLKYNNKKNQENNQPLFFNINNNSNNNYLTLNTTNNNNNNLYINNNNMPKLGEDIIYNRLTNQLSFLKNKLCLISNLNRTRKANNNNINAPILILTNNFMENILSFKASMDVILNYMDNVSEILDKLSCINENSLSLVDSIFNNKINNDNNLLQLESNSNYFSQLLNYNYNMQRMNSELCEIINKQLSI